MISQNSITLQVNLARDAQPLNSTGKARTRLVIAVNYGYAENVKVDYVDVTVFGATAENAAKHLKQGSEVLIDGHLSVNKHTPAGSDTPVYKLEVIGDRVQFGRKPTTKPKVPAQQTLAA